MQPDQGDRGLRKTLPAPLTASAIDDNNASQNQPVKRTAINRDVSANLKRSWFIR